MRKLFLALGLFSMSLFNVALANEDGDEPSFICHDQEVVYDAAKKLYVYEAMCGGKSRLDYVYHDIIGRKHIIASADCTHEQSGRKSYLKCDGQNLHVSIFDEESTGSGASKVAYMSMYVHNQHAHHYKTFPCKLRN